MTFPHSSLREAMSDWERDGELVRVTEKVDWNLEAGAIARRAIEIGRFRNANDGGQPAILFENIEGYPKGFRVLGNIVSNIKRTAIVFGHPDPDRATWRELQAICVKGLENPVKPIVVKDGPCKENKAFGNDCNLYMFPAPMIHEGDGGRYMCTYHEFVTKDKLTGWQNRGMYRLMIHDKRSLGILMVHGQHGPDMYFHQYEAADEAMPFAISIGPSVLSVFSAAAPVAWGVDEANIVGGWMRKPVEMVKCETNDLLVPASSEIVIEGIVPPRVRAWEGPFCEYTGYRASPRDLRPVCVVRCMTWRNDPIIPMSNMGIPVHDGDTATSLTRGAFYKSAFANSGWPVIDVNVPPEAVDAVVVSVKRGRPRVANGIMNLIQSLPGAIYEYKIIVCDEGVDVFNVAEVFHNLVEKVHPERGIHVWHQQASPLMPFADLKERLDQSGPQVVFDATWPLDWPAEITMPPKGSFAEIYPKETQDKVLRKWEKYGLK